MRTVVARLESNLNATKLLGFTDCYEGKILSSIYYALINIIIYSCGSLQLIIISYLQIAVLLLNAVIRVVNHKIEVKDEKKDDVSSSQANNIKLLLEQVTPVLCSLFELKCLTEINMIPDEEIEQLDYLLNSYCAILLTLSTIAEKSEWVEIICKQVIVKVKKSSSS